MHFLNIFTSFTRRLSELCSSLEDLIYCTVLLGHFSFFVYSYRDNYIAWASATYHSIYNQSQFAMSTPGQKQLTRGKLKNLVFSVKNCGKTKNRHPQAEFRLTFSPLINVASWFISMRPLGCQVLMQRVLAKKRGCLAKCRTWLNFFRCIVRCHSAWHCTGQSNTCRDTFLIIYNINNINFTI